jgi:predicted ATPase
VIESVDVSGFKTLRQVTIPLAPGITVLVGANNSGKSNVLALLSFIYALARTGNLDETLRVFGGADSVLTRGARSELKLEIRFRDGEAYATYRIGTPGLESLEYRGPSETGAIARNAAGTVDIPQLGTLRGPVGAGLLNWAIQRTAPSAVLALHNALTGIVVRDLSVAALRDTSVSRAGVELERDGRNLAAVLDDLHPDIRELVEQDVKAAAHEIKRVIARNAPEPGKKVVAVQETNGGLFTANEMSDGLLLFIGFSTSMALARESVSVLAIEEPERGIHPRRLRDLIDMLKHVARRGKQVIVTTHSPELLDEFRDQPESILILDRDASGTRITRLSDHQEWVDEMKDKALGEIWYSGILGGVPSR